MSLGGHIFWLEVSSPGDVLKSERYKGCDSNSGKLVESGRHVELQVHMGGSSFFAGTVFWDGLSGKPKRTMQLFEGKPKEHTELLVGVPYFKLGCSKVILNPYLGLHKGFPL